MSPPDACGTARAASGSQAEPVLSASLVDSDDAYDDLSERLDAPADPNQRLRRTMLGNDA